MSLSINLRRVVHPAHEPISLAEAKLFLRIEHEAEDALIAGMITAAREAAETVLNISCITQRWQYEVRGCKTDTLYLPHGPTIAVTELAVREQESTVWSIAAGDTYLLQGNRLTLLSQRVALADLRITYDAGFGAGAADVPAVIRQALLQHIACLYETRGTVGIVDLQAIYTGLREVRV